jgi:glutathione S-transferase
MIDFYYWTTPNGHKVTMFLEESGLTYNIKPINISKGEQFAPAFLKIAPNNRIPAIVDHTPVGGGDPLPFLNRVPSFCTWQTRQINLSLRKYVVEMNASNGFFGKWGA